MQLDWIKCCALFPIFFLFLVSKRGKKETRWPAEESEESPEKGGYDWVFYIYKRQKLYMTLKNKRHKRTRPGLYII